MRTWTLNTTEGISNFNKSRAPLVATEVDRFFGNSILTFLNNPEIAVDITPDDLKGMSCANQISVRGKTPSCQRSVFMPGSIPTVLVTEEGYEDAEIAFAYNVKGYNLTFGPGDDGHNWTFDERQDCQTIGLAFGAVRFCLNNAESNVLRARMIRCPSSLAYTSQRCLTDTSWHRNTTASVTTMLTTTYQWADIAFYRSNQSIASFEILQTPETKANINSTELMSAFHEFTLGSGSMQQAMLDWVTTTNTTSDTAGGGDESDLLHEYEDLIDSLLGARELSITKSRENRRAESDDVSGLASSFGDLTSLFTGGGSVPGSNPIFPILPFTYLESCSALGAKNSRATTTCTDFIQNFLAVPLLYCDSLLALRMSSGLDVLSPISDSDEASAALVESFMEYLGIADASKQRLMQGTPGTQVALSRLRHEIVVGRASLIAYAVGTGLVLMFCFAAIGAATTNISSPGYWPLLDFILKFKVLYDGEVLSCADKEAIQAQQCGKRSTVSRMLVQTA
ncbi:hypothetical protein BAUCODRAFT_118389 [Baudoinia panamericana UAMH 10762]|uniref:Uncharacterized protein n=1 Tax=Baudoinia panamericana (strain UAMH 10762) TaxID=717646 RepID=M2N906_BAUPA|nr:uncharacterized protein BAUCODRAFT_118389 [Baudoinia panamericana UAMH 10762]EMD00639.1 hypothetical protein BAUCODRAFT_118389 [Baudoinia panamericana UAMH 10762]